MRPFTPNQFLLTLLGLSIVLIFLRFFMIIAFPDPLTLDRGKIQKIYPGQTFSEQFIAERNNLQVIQILLRTPGVKDGDFLIAKLADATCQETFFEGTFEAPFLNTDDMYRFTFPRIADSKGKTYCLLLSFQTNNTKTKYLRLFTTPPTDTTTPLLNTATTEPLNGASLSLRTVYRNDHWWEDLHELNQRISQYKPWFLKDFSIGAIGILFIILSVGLITLLINAGTLQKKEKS